MISKVEKVLSAVLVRFIVLKFEHQAGDASEILAGTSMGSRVLCTSQLAFSRVARGLLACFEAGTVAA